MLKEREMKWMASLIVIGAACGKRATTTQTDLAPVKPTRPSWLPRRIAVLFLVAACFATGCTTVRSLEFKPSTAGKRLGVRNPHPSWLTAETRPEDQIIFVRNENLGKPYDACLGGRALQMNVYVVPGVLSPSRPGSYIRRVEIFEGFDLGFFEIQYGKRFPDLEQAVADIRKLLTASGAEFAECGFEPDDPRKGIRRIRGYVMKRYSGFDIDRASACGRKN